MALEENFLAEWASCACVVYGPTNEGPRLQRERDDLIRDTGTVMSLASMPPNRSGSVRVADALRPLQKCISAPVPLLKQLWVLGEHFVHALSIIVLNGIIKVC